MNVKISQVNNLTDARYFAAAGVHYLGFCCNPSTTHYCSINHILDICQWVDGPQFVLEFDGWQSVDEIATLQGTMDIHGLHFGAFSNYVHNFEVPIFKDYIFENLVLADFTGVDFPVIRTENRFSSLSDDQLASIVHHLGTKTFYLDIPFDIPDLERMVSFFPDAGLILRGGSEEKTGLKSFDQLDIIFEILQIV